MKAEALNQFKELLQTKVNDYYLTNYKDSFLNGCHRTEVKLIEGKKYYKINVGDSGKFMYDTTNDNLYFIKGYGVIDRAKNFGEIEAILNTPFHYDGYSIAPLGKRTNYGYAGKIA